MAAILSWKPGETTHEVIRRLTAGQCVLLPTEATYELTASALDAEALTGLGSDHSPAIILSDYANLSDWLPLLSGAGRRLYHKFGAGPITLRARPGPSSGHWPCLPESTRRLLLQDGRIDVRWPSHPIWDELRVAGLPLASVPIEAGIYVAEALRQVGGQATLAIDDGPTQYRAMPTLVQAEGRRCRVLRVGALSADQIEELALCRIVFICTGNTCRSPMAEVLCRELLANALGCSASELETHGIRVESAGLSAWPGGAASPEAVRTVADMGADLTNHRSQPATLEMLLWADHVLCMTASHAQALSAYPQLPAPRLLSPRGDDVADPIGGEASDYRTCAEQIIQYLRARLPELLEP